MKRTEGESGAVFVEAAVVFPIMFLIIFFMIYAGNAYLQKCRINAVVNEMTLEGAGCCADPLLNGIKERGEIPSLSTLDIKPYRYLFTGSMNEIADEIKAKIESKLSGMSGGLFSNMRPEASVVEVAFKNGFIYSTFSVQVEYKIKNPIKLPGLSDYFEHKVLSRADMPLSDSTEFIRNMDMVEDYIEKYTDERPCDKIAEMIDKVKEWFKNP